MKRRGRITAALFVVAGVSAATGTAHAADLFAVAGGGTRAPAAGVTATSMALGGDPQTERGVAALPDGGFLIGANDLLTVGGDGVVTRRVSGAAITSGMFDYVLAASPSAEGSAYAVMHSGAVVRVAGDGSVARVVPPGYGFEGDGGPAANAKLRGPSDVSATGDGGVLVADTVNHRIRRIDPTGVITTVAGSGDPSEGGFAGDGGPATAARLRLPEGVAALPDGGFLIADSGNRRVRRVAPDGRIETIAGSGAPGHRGDGGVATAAALSHLLHDVAVAGDGSVLVADDDRVRRFAVGGVIETIAGGADARAYAAPNPYVADRLHPRDPFDSDGLEGRRAGLPRVSQLSATSDGGVLMADGRKVRYLAPASTERLAVAIRSVRLTRNGGTINAVVTRAARLQVAVRRRGRTVSTATAEASPGSNAIQVASLPAGSVSTIQVRAAADSGQRATDQATVVGGPRLPRAIALRVARDAASEIPADGGESDVATCPRSVRGRRTECRVLASVDDEPYSCLFIVAVSVGGNGQVYRQDKSCRRRQALGPRVAPLG
jgi:hypothetical protein